jgi:hypothetical protein
MVKGMVGAQYVKDKDKSDREVYVERKIPGGKYLKIALLLSDLKIEKISITGDFFVYPESFIESLENYLIDHETESEIISSNMKSFLMDFSEAVEFVGIRYEDVIELTVECINKSRNLPESNSN